MWENFTYDELFLKRKCFIWQELFFNRKCHIWEELSRNFIAVFCLISRYAGRDFARRRGSFPEGDSGDEDTHQCLLDVISVTLSDMDLFTAKHVWKSDYKRGDLSTDMEFTTFVVEREVCNVHFQCLFLKCVNDCLHWTYFHD